MLEELNPLHVPGTENCDLAEGPLWDAARQCLFWTDINAGKIFRLDAPNSRPQLIYEGEPVGGFTLQTNGDLLLFRVNDIALLDANGNVSRVRDFSDEGMTRFNDVIADPAGRVFAGTIGKSPNAGLYRMNLTGEITRLVAGSACSNGMGFSPDLQKFYWTCTTRRQIFEFNYDANSGDLSDEKIFYAVQPGEGVPDGLTVDAEGCVWSARWNGASLVRHAPDGTVLGKISFPSLNISSTCFGGENLDELFVTAAKDANNPAPHLRGLFLVKTPFRGKLEFRSKIVV